MASVRASVEAEIGADRRPAVLRKDFIIDEYQVMRIM
jgi:indole-3-glycerol phosphate synthase